MTRVAILGGGAFGTALAMALSGDGSDIRLWTRDAADAEAMRTSRRSGRHLPGLPLPDTLSIDTAIPEADIYLVGVPAQSVRSFLETHGAALAGADVVSCAKGIEIATGLGPLDVVRDVLPSARPACLTGPSFAADIARGLPTALVLAARDGGDRLQAALSRPRLRIYRSDDVIGVQLGGALKNVIALASGMAIGAGYGDSARASVIARGFAEMVRYSTARGAEPETLQGLSGLGDLVLTCTSEKSRNFAAGLSFGRGEPPEQGRTIEGIATAAALVREAEETGLDLPLIRAVHAVATGERRVADAVDALLSRPPRKE